MNIFHKRQGQTFPSTCYFYTETINGFCFLLSDDRFKMIVIESLQYLVRNGLVVIYGYVIMPNHIHLIWDIKRLNGKESPSGSFAKYTAHRFRRLLLDSDNVQLDAYKVEKSDRFYQFWKRDPLAIPLSSEDNLVQKLEYIHCNPIKDKWNLCQLPEGYRWSSARFYVDGYDEFGLLTHYKD